MNRAGGGSARPNGLLLRGTWRRIAAQTAMLFAVGVVALDVLAVATVLNAEQRDATRQLDMATNDPDALTNPPVDIVVYRSDGGTLRSSPGAPSTPIDPQALRDGVSGDHVVHAAGRAYLVRTYRVGDVVIQVGLDLDRQERERARLYMGLAVAGALGVGVAGVLGAIIARRAMQPLGQAIERQQRFVADASHELRTPLAQLHTRAQLIERQLGSAPDPELLRSDVEQLLRGTRQMSELVDELLVSAQLRAQPHRLHPVDLHRLALEVAEAEQPRAAQRTVAVEVLADPLADHRVRGAETPLRRVVSSLVDNALGHTPPGGHIAIRLSTSDKGVVELEVCDDGEGFDGTVEAAKLFDRFYRGGHGDGRRFGLGLALVREVVAAHRGSVSTHAAPGRGACFVVRLPAWSPGPGPKQRPALGPVSRPERSSPGQDPVI